MTQRTADNTTVLDGSPRYAHKTTTFINQMAESTDTQKLVICHNHQLAHEICTEHLTDDEHGPGVQRRVVHLQGKERACPGCTHSPSGDDFYRYINAAEEALTQHRLVTPDVFAGEDICPHYAHQEAAKRANWIVTVPQKLDRLVTELDVEATQVLIDEESTMKQFFAQSGKLVSFKKNPGGFGPDILPVEEDDIFFDGTAIQNVGQRIQNKIDGYDRVPSRYRNAQRAWQALQTFRDHVLDTIDVSDYDDPEDLAREFDRLEFPDVEMTGSEREKTATFTYIRRDLGRFAASNFLEAALTDPQIVVQKSGEKWNIYLVPNPLSDFLYHRELFENAAEVNLVGDRVASDFAARFMDPADVSEARTQADDVETDNLEIVVLSGSENSRRHAATQISQQLINNGVHSLLIAGSGLRAANAYNRLHPDAYFFQGDATLDHYQTAADAGWSVVSYMGSRITRGVDVDTQVTVVRSMQFASPMWQAHPHEEYGERMMNYENVIELHNAMLRGAGQGEQHVAIIPEPLILKFGLHRYATEFDIQDIGAIVEFVLSSLGLVPTATTLGTYVCEVCGEQFVTIVQYDAHECSPAH